MTVFRLMLLEPVASFRSEIARIIRQGTGLPPIILDEIDAPHALLHALDSCDTPYDIAIVSLDSPGSADKMDIGALCVRFPMTSFVAYSASNRLMTAQQAHVSGAAGYFRRDSPPELILNVIGIVLGGEAFAIPDHLRFKIC
jgi:DNA-binding NarL/FixJ family response regulator